MDKQMNESAERQQSLSKEIETKFTLVDIINMMLTFWWLIAVLAILVGGSTYVYSRVTSIPQYSSSGTIYINTQKEQKTEDVNANALKSVMDLMPTYIEVLQSKPFLQQVSDDIDNKYSFSEIKEAMTIKNIENTNMLTISVNNADSHDAYLICTSIINNAFDEIIRVFEGGSVKLINVPESTHSLKRGIIGFCVGAVIAMLIIFLINLFDTRVKSSEELTNRYKLPILGEVPNLHNL